VTIAILYLEGVHNYHGQHKLFTGNYIPPRNCVCVYVTFLLGLSEIVVETIYYEEKFINCRGTLLSFRSLKKQWKPLSENGIYVAHDFLLLMEIIQKLALQTYFPRKRNLSVPSYGDHTKE
jgi:hypothetical protein